MFLLILTDLTLGILWWPSSLQHISQSEPSIARLTNHSTVFRHQMVAVIRCWPLTIECLSTPTPYIGSNVPVSFIIRRLHCTGASKCKHRENWKQKPAPARAKSPAGRWEDSYQDCQGWSFHCSRISKPCLKWTCTLYSASLEKKEFWNGGWGFFDNTWQILGWETWAGQGRPASNINLSEADLDWHKSHSDL